MKTYCNIFLCAFVLILCLEYSLCRQTWLKEGKFCMDGSKNGTCMPYFKCKTRTPQRNIRDYPRCSVSNRVRIICCANGPNGTPTKNREQPIIDPITRKQIMKTGQKAWDKCLDYLKAVNYECKAAVRVNHVSSMFDHFHRKPKANKTITGGENALKNQFAHMALLGYGDERKFVSWMCGGSLISEKFVLTAGHCISHVNLGPVKYIVLGILKRSDLSVSSRRYLVQKIIPHPDYHSPIKYNDIALLETARRVDFTTSVAPACLAIPKPPHHSPTLRRQGVSATGWGFLSPNTKLADTLQVAYLKEYNANVCSKLYPVHRHLPRGYNQTTQVCYGDKENKRDTCQGDSGGPLQIPGQASDCQFSIIAVTSYGMSCPSKAGMYTRVAPYLSWIESIVWS